MPFRRALSQLGRDETGAAAIEYGLIVAMIGLAALVAMQGTATETAAFWEVVRSAVVTED